MTVVPAAMAGFKKGSLVYPPSTTTHSVFPACFTSAAIHSTRRAASSSLVRNRQPRFLGMVGIVFWRTYSMARSGKASVPHNGCRRASDSVTQMCPYRYFWSAGPGVGLWWMSAPSTFGPYRLVGESSMTTSNRSGKGKVRNSSRKSCVATDLALRPRGARK